MKVDDYIKIIAGSFILISALLAKFVNINFIYFTMFVGVNMFQYGLSKKCPMAALLKRIGVKE